MRRLLRWLVIFSAFFLVLGVVGAGGAVYVFYHYGKGLPEHRQLADYEPPTVTRVHAGDGRLLAEFAIEKRVFVPISSIPRRVINAFVSAEDQHFYSHFGVDPKAVLRAILTNVKNYSQGRRPVGASTITQQVAKNFLLTNEVSYKRKIREAILAIRIENVLSKERILELYLNEIYLGFGSYGVAAAALNYFDKSLDELTVGEAAYLAALPKAPNNYHPIRKREAAINRRNWVIGRLLDDRRITPEAAGLALAEDLAVRPRAATELASADFFTEEVRRELIGRFGERALYEGGLSVRTTVDPRLQEIADRALRQGLISYDRRHGWRGPLGTVELAAEGDWLPALAAFEVPPGGGDWLPAVVLEAGAKSAKIGLADASLGAIPYGELRWARPTLKKQKIGARPKKASDVLSRGDIVFVEPVSADGEGKAYPEGSYGLRQLPDVNGALVAMDPHTGRVLAMSGGFSYALSQFNRATQARRQPGSAFKPFVYLAGLDSGYTPATLILDAPFVIDQGAGQGKWKPSNYTNKFYGPTPMRVGIEKSRNLMTVRLAQTIGMPKVAAYARRFGIVDEMPEVLAMALGAGETSLLRLTTGYAMLVNGGRRTLPTLIDRIQDKNGNTVFRHDQRDCADCRAVPWRSQAPPLLPDLREQVADPASAYQVVGMLEGVVKRGTGRRIAEIGKPLGGKTGTTNNNTDTWFIGFTPDLVVGAFVGFDEPRTLGPKDTGSNVAAPLFKSFMAEVLADKPGIPFRVPPGIRLVRISADTGLVARAGDKHVYLEAFKPNTVPTDAQVLLDGGYNPYGKSSRSSSTGGLY